MDIIGAGILLLFTFYLIARVVDVYFIESLEIISKRMKLSSDIAGATFMAMGSSAPELFVSFLALTRVGASQSIGAGTIVGSAIFNILVIIGASALFKRAVLTWQPVIRDLLFYIVAILVLFVTFSDGQITLVDALVFVGLYVVYLASFGVWKRLLPYEVKGDVTDELIEEEEAAQYAIRAASWSWKTGVDKVLSLAFVDLKARPQLYWVNFGVAVGFLGILTHFMVEAAVHVAHGLGVSEVVIGLTILAAGTSVPDLLSSITVAKKGRGDMAIANAVGSNIFDIAIGLGFPWLMMILWTGATIPVLTENLISSIVLLFATVVALLFLLMAKRWEIGRYAGVLLIGLYGFYVLTAIGLVSFQLCVNVGSGLCVGM